MANGILQESLKEFELALDDLTSNLEFVRAARQLRPRLSDMLDWQHMDDEAKRLAGAFLRQRTEDESVLYRGMVVSLAGAFEQFVRRVLRDSIRAINTACGGYDRIHEEIRRQNVYRSGLAMQTIFEPPDYLELDYELLSKNIGTCFVGSPQAVLNADAFTIFLSIISPEKLGDALKRVGVTMNWDALGAIEPLRKAVDTQDTRETAKAIQESLKKFGRMRNKIAHSGSTGLAVSESELEQLLKFFRVFARGFSNVVAAGIKKLLPK
jgi:hypothetical protein